MVSIDKNQPGDHGQRRRQRDQIARQHLRQGPGLQQRTMRHHQPGETARCEHHHRDEDQSEIELPHLGEIAETERQQRDEDRADDRPDEETDAADIGRKQHGPRLLRAQIGRVRDLEIDRRQRPRDAGKEAGEAERQITHDVRIVADELNALRIVAHGVAHASQRRAGQRVHRDHRDQRPRRHQIVDLDLRAETPAEQLQQFGAVGGDAGFAAEEGAQDQRGGGDQFAHAERDHGKGRA